MEARIWFSTMSGVLCRRELRGKWLRPQDDGSSGMRSIDSSDVEFFSLRRTGRPSTLAHDTDEPDT